MARKFFPGLLVAACVAGTASTPAAACDRNPGGGRVIQSFPPIGNGPYTFPAQTVPPVVEPQRVVIIPTTKTTPIAATSRPVAVQIVSTTKVVPTPEPKPEQKPEPVVANVDAIGSFADLLTRR